MKADCKIIALLALLITTAPFAVAQDGDGKERTAGNKNAAQASGRDGKKKTSTEQKKAASKTADKAAENNSAKSSASRNNRTTSRPTVNRLPAADVESALRFARKHHPELARLLEKLRGK